MLSLKEYTIDIYVSMYYRLVVKMKYIVSVEKNANVCRVRFKIPNFFKNEYF